jgi:hypothetical protein
VRVADERRVPGVPPNRYLFVRLALRWCDLPPVAGSRVRAAGGVPVRWRPAPVRRVRAPPGGRARAPRPPAVAELRRC